MPGSSQCAVRPDARSAARDILVLVVDDDPEVRVIVAECLEEAGFDTIQAENGLAALRLLAENRDVKLIISDIRMPQMSGIELAEAARRQQPDLAVILISGYFLPQQVGFPFLRKPFRLAELRAAIETELAFRAAGGNR